MDIRDFTAILCVSRKIDTWHIVYLSNKDPCPKILAHKSEIKVVVAYWKVKTPCHAHGECIN